MRQSRTVFKVIRSLREEVPLPRFAPDRVRKSVTAAATEGGLGHVVAALFR
jgi:hypothetical protein